MIKDMSPQPYPLWAVEDGDDAVLLVLGWIAEDGGLTPVVAGLAISGEAPEVIRRPYALYDNRSAAELVARANAARQG